jgi:RNA polymerase sigma-70 factor (ECF subfamily)
MDEKDWLAAEFEAHRVQLRAVAHRMLGSLPEADDALQEAWLRLSRADAGAVDNIGGWLTTVVVRVSLNVLRSRRTRREESLGAHVPEPIASQDTEHDVVLADSVGFALLVVLGALDPAEQLAFVLHDVFAVPFDEIAPIVERSPEAARQLASRARRHVRRNAPVPDADLAAQWQVVDAFLAAARDGDFDALVAVLDPDVVLRADGGLKGASRLARGAETVAGQALMWSQVELTMRRALINGAAGIVSLVQGRPFSVGAVTVRNGRIVEIDILADPDRLAQIDLTHVVD